MALADLVLLNANVLTMNPRQPIAEAVAVKGDRIINVGANNEVSKLIGDETRVIRLKGKSVLPGIIDTHIHVADFGKILSWISLEDVDSIADVQDRLSKRVAETPKGRWILGKGWDQNRFAEKRLPTRFDLDAVAPDNPVVLYHQSGQLCIANTKALTLAGVAQEVATAPGGSVDRNSETDEPTGVLLGDAMNLVWRVVPEPSEGELLDAVEAACKKIVEAGVTSIHWIILSPVELSIIQELYAQCRLNLRVYVIIPANLLEKLPSSGFVDEMLRFGGAVIFADGYLAARTAAMSQPYSGNNAPATDLLYTQEALNKLAIEIHQAGLQLIVHAVGDKAVDAALTAIEVTSSARGNTRSRIEQAAVLNDTLIKRIKKQEVLVSVQPNVIASEFSVWSAAERLGVERARWLFPLKTLLKKGVCVAGGSDCPMEPLSPFSGVQAAVTREFFSEERVSVDDALRMYTVNAAYSSFEERLKGTIEAGKLADFTVLANDPRNVPPSEIGKVAVEMTIIGGKVVYQKVHV